MNISTYQPVHPETGEFIKILSGFLDKTRKSKRVDFHRHVYQYSRVLKATALPKNQENSYEIGEHVFNWLTKIWQLDFDNREVRFVNDDGFAKKFQDEVNNGFPVKVAILPARGQRLMTIDVNANGVKMNAVYAVTEVGLAPGKWVNEPAITVTFN